jgi:hypothetical protein
LTSLFFLQSADYALLFIDCSSLSSLDPVFPKNGVNKNIYKLKVTTDIGSNGILSNIYKIDTYLVWNIWATKARLVWQAVKNIFRSKKYIRSDPNPNYADIEKSF